MVLIRFGIFNFLVDEGDLVEIICCFCVEFVILIFVLLNISCKVFFRVCLGGI